MSKDYVHRVTLEELIQTYIYENSHKGLYWHDVEGYTVNEAADGSGIVVDIVFDD
ncbi:hypothetical protein [Salmonella phage SSBI34]|nr:hypothetical protein [Salmonella phage SSBI34]